MERNNGSARMESTEAIIDEWTMEAGQDEETTAAVDFLAGREAHVEDVEPWQRLGDILGRIIGMVEVD